MAIENLEKKWEDLSCPAGETEEVFWHKEGSGKGYGALGLKCRATGRRVWIWDYRDADGKKQRRTYGSPDGEPDGKVPYGKKRNGVSYDEAQRCIVIDRAKIAEGLDPAEEAKAAQDASERTIGDLIKLYLEDLETGIYTRKGKVLRRRPGYLTRVKQLLEPLRLKFRDRAATAVTRDDIHALLDPYNNRPSQQHATQRQVKAFFHWCSDRYSLPHVTNGMKQRGGSEERKRFLNDDELKLLLPELRALGYPYGDIMMLKLLTGRRLREVLEAERSEFDLDRALWCLPGDRAKNHDTHILPLSEPALRIIRSAIEKKIGEGKYIFHRRRRDLPISTLDPVLPRVRKATAPATIRRLEPEQREPWTPHDLRRTAATILDVLEVPDRIIKAFLNHADDLGVTGIYARGDLLPRMRRALDQLAAHYEALASTMLALPKPTLALPAPASDEARSRGVYRRAQAAE